MQYPQMCQCVNWTKGIFSIFSGPPTYATRKQILKKDLHSALPLQKKILLHPLKLNASPGKYMYTKYAWPYNLAMWNQVGVRP